MDELINGFLKEYMGVFYCFDEDYHPAAVSGAWLVQFADFDWYFSTEQMAKAFIWLLNEINKYTDATDPSLYKGYIFTDLDDDVFRFLTPKLVGLIDKRKGE